MQPTKAMFKMRNFRTKKIKRTVLIWKLEAIWWTVTVLLIVAILYPIYKSQPNFPFLLDNTIYIIVFVTLTRYLFLLKHTFLGYLQWLKVIVLFFCIPLVFYLIERAHNFELYTDEIGLEGLFYHLTLKGQTGMVNYVQNEMRFFGVGSIISTIIMPFRMLISFWRTHNKGTV